MSKKVLGLILSAIMILALLPVYAFEAEAADGEHLRGSILATPRAKIQVTNEDCSIIKFSLFDCKTGEQVGQSVDKGFPPGSWTEWYFVNSSNDFQLSENDVEKTIRLQMEGTKGSETFTVQAEGEITLKAPRLVVPSSVNISDVKDTYDLMDPSIVKGLVLDYGSCATSFVVQKKVDGGWEDVQAGTPFTVENLGVYRIYNSTPLGEYYSNEVNIDAYTITFTDEDETELQTVKAASGDIPEYPEPLPTKPDADGYARLFVGWEDSNGTVYNNDELPQVTGNMTYKAVYSTKKILTIKAIDQSYMYNGKTQGEGDTTYDDAAEIAEKVEVDGLFDGDSLMSITLDGQGDEIKTYPLVPSGAAIGGVHGNESYDIRYVNGTLTITSNLFSIEFVNDDGTVLQSSLVAYGEMPKYEGKEPEKPATVQYSYTFAGWDPEITAVAGAATYTAKYDKAVNKYDLTFDLGGGTLNGQTGKITMNCEYGSTIKLPGAPVKEGYKFLYWKGSQYEAGAEYLVEGPHNFTAVWEETSPKTGDNSNLILWAAILGGSLLFAILLIFHSRRDLKNHK